MSCTIDNDRENEPRRRQDKVENLTVKYFREISSYPLLDIKQEKELSQKIIHLEQRQWANVLASPLRASEFASILGSVFPELRPELRFIYLTTRVYRKRRGKLTKKQWSCYHAKVDTLTLTLRDCDIDRIYLDEFVDVIISHEEERSNGKRPRPFVKKIRKTREAIRNLKNFFIASNLRLVISIAKKHYSGSLPLMDLVQEGNLGLLKAIERFKPCMGYRFSTYASWWIRHAINRALADKSRTVRLPVHMLDATQKIRKLRNMTMTQQGREPSDEEISDKIGINMKKLRKVQRHHAGQTLSLDKKIDDDSQQSFIDMIHDSENNSPAEKLAFKDWCSEICRLLNILSPIEADVVRFRYGIENEDELTLKEIGEKYCLSRERIRQIQKSAIEKLRLCVKGLY